MPGSTTIYDVKIRYAMDKSNAKDGLNGIAGAADRAAQKTMSLRGALAAVGGTMLLAKAKSALVDFNSEIDSMKINLSTIMQLQLKMPFEKANVEANKLFNTFQEMAKQSPATTKDFMSMAAAIAAPIAMLGGGPDKLAKFTQGAIIAGQAFSERADIVALDIKQMLMGTVTARDRIAQQLINSKGMDAEKFNAMTAVERATFTEGALQSEPLKKAAAAMGESFAGQTAAFKDNLQIALGQVGRPLMESLTAEAKKMNTWIAQHPKYISMIVKDLGGMIKGAFGFVKDAAGWLVEHSDLLLSIGKTFLIFKGAQLGTNIFKNFVGGITGLVGQMKTAGGTLVGMFGGSGGGGVGGAFKGLIGILSGAGGVIPALGLFIGAIDIARNLLNTHAAEDKKGKAAAMDLMEAAGDIPTLQARAKELEGRLKNPAFAATQPQDIAELSSVRNRLYNPETIGLALRKIDEASVKHGGSPLKNLDLAGWQIAERMLPSTFDSRDIKKSAEMAGAALGTLNMFKKLTTDMKREALKHAFPERWGSPAEKASTEVPDVSKWINTPGKSDVNVTIQRIEVASEDPDRFVHGMVNAAEQVSKNPTQAASVIVGGF